MWLRTVLGVSALVGRGLEELKGAILERALGRAADGSEEVLVSTERQRALLEDAAAAAERAAAVALERPPEIVALELREAATRLGQITGEEVGEDMLDRLFARFCIGK